MLPMGRRPDVNEMESTAGNITRAAVDDDDVSTDSHILRALSASGPNRPRARLEARSGWCAADFKELWAYRELLGFFAARDIKVRYKQTALGALWAVIQPVTQMVLFTLIFGYLGGFAKKSSVPYPFVTYASLFPLQRFAYALGQASNSMVENAHLITKVYFPRLIVPLASIISGLVDFGISFVILLVLMFAFGIAPSLAILTLPFFLLLAIATALGVGLWLSALNVQFRDVRYVIPFRTQVWLFVTPVIYQSSSVPERWRPLLGLNPMAGVVEGFRWALLGAAPTPGPLLVVSVGVTAVLLVTGMYYFRRMERTFADVV